MQSVGGCIPLTSNIPIKYFNCTGQVDFQVMVYTKNYCACHAMDYEVVWRMLRGQGSVEFNYPLQAQVGAWYESENGTVKCGPVDADPGSTWEIIHEYAYDTPIIKKSELLFLYFG